jgi:hypothetical protein
MLASEAIGASLRFAEPPTSPEPAGDGPNAIASADFDGDGDNDLAVANYASNNVMILKNKGGGNFVEPASSPVAAGFHPFAIAAADLDRDGDMDLAVANTGSSNVTILKNHGGGKFTETVSSPIAVGTFPQAIVAADLDGDGDYDLAVANFQSDNVTILKNNGGGKFVQPATSPEPAGDGAAGIAAGDFDGDGDNDLAVANWFSKNVTILKNNLSGDFVQPPSSPVAAGNGPYSVAAADLDGDADIDLAVVNELGHNITILLNDVSGNFSQPATSPEAVGSTPTSIIAADFDGDGDNDLAISNFGSDNATLLRNDLAGNFTQPGSSPEAAGDGAISITTADLDGDGDKDLAVANQNSDNVTILKNR